MHVEISPMVECEIRGAMYNCLLDGVVHFDQSHLAKICLNNNLLLAAEVLGAMSISGFILCPLTSIIPSCILDP